MPSFRFDLGTRPLLGAMVVVAAVFYAYHGSYSVPFFFDDLAAITQNPTIRHLWPLSDVLWPPNDGSGMAGRPMVNLSLALNYAMGGIDPRGYHLFNVSLHALSGLTLFGFLRRAFRLPLLSAHIGAGTGGLALLVALIWSTHPLQTESVTCVIQRTELLVGFFYLFTLYAFVRGSDAPHPRWWRTLSILACILGMASKEVMVSAPLMVLLFDRTFVSGSFRAAWNRFRSFYLTLFATWVVLGSLLLQMGGSRGAAAGFGLGISWWSYALKQSEAIVTYLALTVFPHPLVIDYGTDVITEPLRVLPQLLAILTLAVLALLALKFRPALGFVGLWFFAILAPSSSVVPLVTQTVAEHRMYLPLAAVVTLLGLGAHQLAGRVVFAAGALLVLACIGLTVARNRILQDEVALWGQTITAAPTNARAHASLGLALSDRGRAGDAIPHFNRALALDPQSTATEQNLGNAYFQLRDFNAAATHFRRAIALKPTFASGYNNLGATLLELNNTQDAIEALQEALRLEPGHVGAHQNLARALFGTGRFAEAVRHYEFVLERRSNSPDAHYDLGLALARSGDYPRAMRHFGEVLRLRPSAGSYLNYARFLVGIGRRQEAIAALETALRLQPSFSDARQELERLRAAP